MRKRGRWDRRSERKRAAARRVVWRHRHPWLPSRRDACWPNASTSGSSDSPPIRPASPAWSEVHEQARRQADLYVAGLLAKASEQPETAPHIDNGIGAAEVPRRPVETKVAPWWSAFWVAWRSR